LSEPTAPETEEEEKVKPTLTTPTPAQTWIIVARILKRYTHALEPAFAHARNRNVRRLVEFDYTYPNSTSKGLLFYDSGFVTVPGHGRERSCLFLLPDATWLLIRTSPDPDMPSQIVPHRVIVKLRPTLKELGLQGRIAVRSIHRLLVFLEPKTSWPMNWNGLEKKCP